MCIKKTTTSLFGMLLILITGVTQAGPLIYVANSLSNSVSVIDTDTETVTHTIAIEGGEPVAVAAHPFEPIAYVNDRELGKTYVIDTRTHTITTTIEYDQNPDAGVIFNREGTRAYVTQRVFPDTGILTVIDASTHTVIETIPVGNAPSGVVIHPDGHTAYVSNFLSDDNYIVDLTTSTVLDILPGGENPQGVTMPPDGKFAYIPNRSGDTLTVIDTNSNSIVATIPVGPAPGLAGFLPDSSLAYIPSRGDKTIAVVDMSTHTVIDEIENSLGSNVWVIVHPDGDRLYTTHQQNDVVSIVDTVTLEPIQTIDVGEFPIGFAFVPVADLSADSASPSRIRRGSTRNITVTGTGFRPDTLINIPQRAGVLINSVTFVNDNSIIINLTASRQAEESTRDFVIRNADQQRFVLTDAITVVSQTRP